MLLTHRRRAAVSLLTAGAAVNQAGDSGVTALVDAAFNGHASASSLLLLAEQEGHAKNVAAMLWKR